MRTTLTTERLYTELQSAIQDNAGVECAQVPEAFFPDDEKDSKQRAMMVQVAKQLCSSCPVKAPCAAYALASGVAGIWGGTTPIERGSMRRKVVLDGME